MKLKSRKILMGCFLEISSFFQGSFQKRFSGFFPLSDISAGHNRGFLSTCNVCGKETPFNDMRCHVETNHITGVSHSCSMCGKISRIRQALRMHKLRNHNNDRTPNSMFCSLEIFIEKYKMFLCNFLTVSIFASPTVGIYECHPVPTFLPLRSIWNA